MDTPDHSYTHNYSRAFGHGYGYGYVSTSRFHHVFAESLEIARLCVCPTQSLRKVRAFTDTRKHFIFAR